MLFIGIGVFMNGVNDVLDGKFDDKLCLSFIIPTILTLVLFILWLVLKLAKAKKAASVIGKASGVLLIALGVYGVALALVNAVMLVLGKTAESFGHWLVLHHIGFAGLVALPPRCGTGAPHGGVNADTCRVHFSVRVPPTGDSRF